MMKIVILIGFQMFVTICLRFRAWDTPESMSYSWLSEAMDLSHMVMDIRKQIKITVFIIPINFCFNNIAKKSYHGTPQDHALLLAVRGSEPQADCHRHPENN